MELSDILTTVLIVLTGVGLAWIAKKWLNISQATPLAVIILLPLVAHLAISGKLADFNFLGASAKFRQDVQGTKVFQYAKIADVSKYNDLFKDGVTPATLERAQLVQACWPYIPLRADFVPPRYKKGTLNYSREHKLFAFVIGSLIRNALVCGELRAVVVLSENETVIGYFDPAQFLEILRTPLVSYDGEAIDPLIAADALLKTELGAILAAPIQRAKSVEASQFFIDQDQNVFEAFKKLQKQGVKLAVVTEPGGKFKGIVTRDELADAFLLTLLSKKPKKNTQ